jgi:hypothetical protein
LTQKKLSEKPFPDAVTLTEQAELNTLQLKEARDEDALLKSKKGGTTDTNCETGDAREDNGTGRRIRRFAYLRASGCRCG